MTDPTLEISALSTLDAISPEDWDACACPEAVDGRAIGIRRSYAEDARGERLGRREMLRRRGIDLVEMDTDGDYVGPLVQYFREREKRS